jgi:hypothetical protein
MTEGIPISKSHDDRNTSSGMRPSSLADSTQFSAVASRAAESAQARAAAKSASRSRSTPRPASAVRRKHRAVTAQPLARISPTARSERRPARR